MKTNPQCAIVGCASAAADKHHIGGASSPMIWVCKECHGRIHGLQWNAEHANLTRAGLAKARAQGRRGGNPKLLDGDRDFIEALTAKRKERHRQQIIDGMNEWFPLVQELRPLTNWKDVARYVSQRTGVEWSQERLRRTVMLLVLEGIVDGAVLGHAPMRRSDRVKDHLIPLVKALSPGRTLAAVATELERMGERTTKGGTRWHASSVANLLKEADEPRQTRKAPGERFREKLERAMRRADD